MITTVFHCNFFSGMSVSRTSSSSPVDFAPVVPDPADISAAGGPPTSAIPTEPQQQQLLGSLLDAVSRLTLLIDQRLPASANPVAAPVPVPPPPVVAQTPPATAAASPGPPLISPVLPYPADLTFEALGAGQGLYLYTPSVKIPLVRRTSQLNAMPLQWDADDAVLPGTPPPALPTLPSGPILTSSTVPVAPPAPPAANHFAGLVSGLQDGSRRLSQTTRAVRGSTDLSAQTPTQVVLHPPRHDIELSSLSVNAIIKFITDIIDYQYRYRVPLQVPSLIRPAIVREVMARHPKLNYATFQSLDAEQVFQLLQFEMAPTTAYEVINRLERSVRFNLADSAYRPSSRDYRPFYSALLNYIRDFTLAYDLITGLLPAELIPKLSTKDLGILKVFLSKIPFDYGWRLHGSYLQDQISTKPAGSSSLAANSHPINNFHRYLSAFSQYVNQHFNVYRDCRTFEQFFGGTSFHGGSNKARPRQNQSQKLNALPRHNVPDPDDASSASSDSSDSADTRRSDDSDDPPNNFDTQTTLDMVYPEQEDTLDDGNMYADTPETAFIPSAADSGLSMADAHALEATFHDDSHALHAFQVPRPDKDLKSAGDSRGSTHPRPAVHPASRSFVGIAPPRASSPSRSAHSSVNAYGHRRSADSRHSPRLPPSSSNGSAPPTHPNSPSWKRVGSSPSRSSSS